MHATTVWFYSLAEMLPMYSYQYMTASKELIFRYDNTEHHKKLNLPNYPHHKHDGSQDNVISSNAPTLAEVLKEIEGMLE